MPSSLDKETTRWDSINIIFTSYKTNMAEKRLNTWLTEYYKAGYQLFFDMTQRGDIW